jgi:hypothetical protein
MCLTWVGSGLTLQTLDLAGKACQRHSSLLRKHVNYGRKKFYSTGPCKTFFGVILVNYGNIDVNTSSKNDAKISVIYVTKTFYKIGSKAKFY